MLRVDHGASSGRSSVWLERYLGVVEAARSSRVAPTKNRGCLAGFLQLDSLILLPVLQQK